MWSFGVLVYELNYGMNPFYESYMDQMDLFKAVCLGKFTFPEIQIDCNNLITRLLKRRAPFRIGCMKEGGQEIRKHAWFANFDFDALRKKEIKAPWQPNIRDSFYKKRISKHERSDSLNVALTRKQQAHFEDF